MTTDPRCPDRPFRSRPFLRLALGAAFCVTSLLLSAPGELRAGGAKKGKPKAEPKAQAYDLDRELALVRGKNTGAAGLALGRLARARPVEERRDEVVKAILQCLEGKDGGLAGAAAPALATWIAPQTADLPRVVKLLDSKNSYVRAGALEALARVKDKGTAAAVAARLPHETAGACKALLAIGADAEPAVLPFLKNKNAGLVTDCVRLLKKIGTAAGLKELQPLTADKNEWLAYTARSAVRAIKEREANGGKPAVDDFKPRPRTAAPKNDALAKDIQTALNGGQGQRGLALERLARAPIDEGRRQRVVDVILEGMEGTDGMIANYAARALAHWATPDTVSVLHLIDLLDHGNGWVRGGAMEALARIKDRRGVAPIAELMPFDLSGVSRALLQIGPDAEEAVIPYLKWQDKHGHIPGECCRTLKVIGTAKSLAPLEEATRHKLEWVGAIAKSAIRAIKEREANGGRPFADTFKPRPTGKAAAKKDQLARDLVTILGNNQGARAFALDRLALAEPEEERRQEVVDALMECMEGTDILVAWHASRALANWVTADTVSTLRLLAFVDHLRADLRGWSILALGKLRDKRTVEPLADRLPFDLGAAVRALQDVGPDAEAAVLPYLKHKNALVVGECCRLLRAIGTKAALPELKALARQQDPWIALRARRTVAAIEEREARGGKPALAYAYPRRSRGKQPNDALAKDLASVRGFNQSSQLFSLNRLARATPDEARRAEVVDMLLGYADGLDPLVSTAAARAVPNWVSPETVSVPWLIHLTDHGNHEVRFAAMRALARLKDPRGVEPVAELMPFWPGDIEVASRALAAMGPMAEKAVLAHLADKDARLLGESVRVLRKIGTANSLKALEALARGADPRLAVSARSAVRVIGERAANGGKDPVDTAFKPQPRPAGKPRDAALAKLIAALETDDGSGSYVLGQLAKATPDDEWRGVVVERLLKVMEGTDMLGRQKAAEALPNWVAPGCVSVPRLLDLIDYTSPWVRGGAMEALGRLKDKRAVVPLAERLPVDGAAVSKALIQIGPDAEAAVLPYVKDRSWLVGQAACRILKEVGTAASLPALTAAANGGNRMVAEAAVEAIAAIKARQGR